MSVRFVRPELRATIVAGAPLPAWLQRHSRRCYIIAACLAAPPWIKMRDFAALIAERRFKSAATGIPHVLDHIVPVSHPLVCGLTVPWNMQVIDAPLNARKSNKLHYAFQREIFDQPEQLRIF